MSSINIPTSSFPQYLLPPAPFRPARNTPFLPNTLSTLNCKRCGLPLCHTSQIISKGFTGRYGRAYLVSPSMSSSGAAGLIASSATPLPNTHAHRPVARTLVTGAHTVSDISCRTCDTLLGWTYNAAEEVSQRYKVGMFILETHRVRCERVWEEVGEVGEAMEEGEGEQKGGVGEEEFDSQDEDECEDLFAGVWTPNLARKRRRARVLLREKEEVGKRGGADIWASLPSPSGTSRWGGGQHGDFDREYELDEEEAEMNAIMV
ncbi:MAG: hypothetical protein M1829_004963 [Trizodia sp. TS-e1964]|nr:MAG: hypothetical protein M1829_004963 [Trizodia sp. TS-e1964]